MPVGLRNIIHQNEGIVVDIRNSALLLLLFSGIAHAEISEQQFAADCAKISDYARQGEQFYKAKNYAKAREAFEKQVIWSEGCQLDDKAIATAYNNVALTWMREGEWRKARAWLMIKPDDRKSVYNLGLIKDNLAALPVPSTAAGEYWNYVGLGTWETLTIKPLENKSDYQVDFQGYYFGMMAIYYGPNMGEFSEKVTLKNNAGVIALREGDYIHCDISLTVSPDTIDVKTDDPSQCGFGANVSADGRYLRVD
ncbi:tetratricopeptide repeat protein [Citrobacter sp. Awk 4]|uniref:tetratricopeptide repeat protein n=1 Tax=Citrobacter sp. Awk 4 TaxID=2963955 RepID=UPI0023037C1D|nr:tetratricopeptide repeat protein [Citrobacter sp. Awk 4]MDA8479610.1 tetratricopeptide repeat protein [Citrobacter sp. Awk 4]